MQKEKLKELIKKALLVKHSFEFRKLLILSKKERQEGIKTILHDTPLLVFWVEPNGTVIDAKDAHRDHPPHGDKTIFTDSNYKGHLRGRAAFIGDVIYITIYVSVGSEFLSNKQKFLLRKSYPQILEVLTKKHPKYTKQIQNAIFIDDFGANQNI